MENNMWNGLEREPERERERERERVDVERRTKWLSRYKIPGELFDNFYNNFPITSQ